MQPSRFPHGTLDSRGPLAKTDTATITVAELKEYGNITQAGAGKTITLPAAEASLKGCFVVVSSIHASDSANKVTVAAGFGGGGGSYDYITLPALGSALFYCDGTNWYVIGNMDPASS